MKEFEPDKFQHKLNSEFRKIDEFLHEFEKEFVNAMQTIIRAEYPEIEMNDKINEAMLMYANEMINVAESVCDKDLHYPGARLKEELNNMKRVVEKYPPECHDSNFLQQTHHKAEELMVNYYPYVFDLSANGFRLLEKYCQMYNWKFADILQKHSVKTQ